MLQKLLILKTRSLILKTRSLILKTRSLGQQQVRAKIKEMVYRIRRPLKTQLAREHLVQSTKVRES